MPTDSLSASRSGTAVTQLLASSIGKKFLMAVTGLAVSGFVIAHLLGNLLIFAGPDAINAYGQKLRDLGLVLWVLRIGLIVAFVTHIILGIQLRAQNSAARPIGYGKGATIQASLASRYMWLSGLLVLAFIMYHLAQFTFEITHPLYANLVDDHGRHDIYSMIILGFQHWYLVAFYVLGVGLLCWHLSHGIASMFQSLGLMKSTWRGPLAIVAGVFGLLLFIGFSSIPLAVMSGRIQLTGVAH